MKIVILNAYGDKNIGDLAILERALTMLKSVVKEKSQVYIHCENINPNKKQSNSLLNYKYRQSPYGYAIQAKTNRSTGIIKMFRYFYISIISILLVLLDKTFSIALPRTGKFAYINDIKKSDLLISMGGGYIISNHPLKDYFGLTLSLLPIFIAKFYKTKIFFLPISVGPFANLIHKQLSLFALKNNIIHLRENISYDLISDIEDTTTSLHKSPDLALSLPYDKKSQINTFESKYIVLTAREWLPEREQKLFEAYLVKYINTIHSSFDLKTIFVSMANNPIEDDDTRLAQRIMEIINDPNIFSISLAKTPSEVQDLIGKAKLAVCTRMHSAVLSFTTHTPFISIGYGHKTEGLMSQLNLLEWYVSIEDVTEINLISLTKKLLVKSTYRNYIKKMESAQEPIIIAHKKLEQQLAGHIYQQRLASIPKSAEQLAPIS